MATPRNRRWMANLMSDHSFRLDHLRKHTATAHKRIEKVPALARLIASDLHLAEYKKIIAAMHTFHATIEPAIAQALGGIPDAQACLDGQRLEALADDLCFLGVSPTAERAPIPFFHCTANALGSLYVIEGSNLGGRIIARHIASSLALGPGNGARFYGGITAESVRYRWSLLNKILDTYVDDTNIDDLTAGACATFESLELWMRCVSLAEVPYSTAVATAA